MIVLQKEFARVTWLRQIFLPKETGRNYSPGVYSSHYLLQKLK
jgi:hypothetical protein